MEPNVDPEEDYEEENGKGLEEEEDGDEEEEG